MQLVIDSFNERVTELDLYFKMLNSLEEPDVQLHFPSKHTHRYKRPDPDWLKTLKATAFLLLYNLVESSVRDGLGAIYERARADGCTMESLEGKIRKIWIDQNFKTVEKESATLQSFRTKSHELVEMALSKVVADIEKSKIPISGNLDADKIRQVCTKHGISVYTHKAALGGAELSTVKTKRNALAHGNESFSECGRQYTVADLEEMKRQAVIFMRSVLNNIKRYLDDGKYKA